MSKTLKARLIMRKDTEANFESADPVLWDGEEILVVCADGKIKRKLGDGVSRYKQLPFSESGGSGIDIDRILFDGLPYATKTMSSDGKTVTSTDPAGRTLTKTFSNDFKTCTVVLKDENGVVVGKLVKTFSSDGNTISASVTK